MPSSSKATVPPSGTGEIVAVYVTVSFTSASSEETVSLTFVVGWVNDTVTWPPSPSENVPPPPPPAPVW